MIPWSSVKDWTQGSGFAGPRSISELNPQSPNSLLFNSASSPPQLFPNTLKTTELLVLIVPPPSKNHFLPMWCVFRSQIFVSPQPQRGYASPQFHRTHWHQFYIFSPNSWVLCGRGQREAIYLHFQQVPRQFQSCLSGTVTLQSSHWKSWKKKRKPKF